MKEINSDEVKKQIEETAEVALYWYGQPTVGFLDFLQGSSAIPEEWRDLDKTSSELLRKVGINWQRITSKEITNGKLLNSNFKVLIVPSVYMLSKEEVKHIREFVERGGKVFGICTSFMTNILGDGVYFNRYFWQASDRVSLAKNVIDYLLEGKQRSIEGLPGPKSKDKIMVGYWGPLGLPLNIETLRNHSLAPDLLIGCIGVHREGDIEGVSYLSPSSIVKFCQRLKDAKVSFYLASIGNVQIRETYADAKSLGKEVLPYDSQIIRRIKEISGKYFLGCVLPHEPGSAQITWQNFFTSARDMLEAKEKYVKGLRKVIDENKNLGIPSLVVFEHSYLHRYNYEAGIDFDHAETSYGGNVNVQLSSVRGSARAYKKPWASNISIWVGRGNYVGCLHASPDVLQLAFYLSYIYGSNPVISQTDGVAIGAGSIMGKGTSRESIQARYEEVYKNFYRFTCVHPYLGVPAVKIAFLQGNLDAWHDAGQGEGVWGLGKIKKWEQEKDGRWELAIKGTCPEWMYQDPEFGWDYLSIFYPGYTNGKGRERYFSGTPYGQIDITPVEAPFDVLKGYSCLILLGWNTMTQEIYQKLKDYCIGGGHLFLGIPHLSTHIKREDAINGNYTFLKKGDFSDFLGIKVKGKGKRVRKIIFSSSSSYGFPESKGHNIKEIDLTDIELSTAKLIAHSSQGPVLIENDIGKGKVFLLNSWNYPGAKELHSFMEDLIKCVAIKHQGEIRISRSPDIAYGVYQDKVKQTIYLLNVSRKFQSFLLHIGKREIPLEMEGISIKVI